MAGSSDNKIQSMTADELIKMFPQYLEVEGTKYAFHLIPIKYHPTGRILIYIAYVRCIDAMDIYLDDKEFFSESLTEVLREGLNYLIEKKYIES